MSQDRPSRDEPSPFRSVAGIAAAIESRARRRGAGMSQDAEAPPFRSPGRIAERVYRQYQPDRLASQARYFANDEVPRATRELLWRKLPPEIQAALRSRIAALKRGER
jgi:hypothetical protein